MTYNVFSGTLNPTQSINHWATVYRPMLSDRCLSCIYFVLSVMLVYCGHTAGWMKMPIGMEVCLGSGHILLDGDLAPHRKGHSSPHFSAHVYWGQTVAHLSHCW